VLQINQSTLDMKIVETVEAIAAKKRENLKLLRQLRESGPRPEVKGWAYNFILFRELLRGE